MNTKGFTLVEILVAVMILVLMVTAAVPIYERAIEKSRIAEVRSTLKQLADAKLRVMDNIGKTNYLSTDFGIGALDVQIPCESGGCKTGKSTLYYLNTKSFQYTLSPSSTYNNSVCAVRLNGDYKGVNFLYSVNNSGEVSFRCNNGGVSDGCATYGMESSSDSAYCTITNS